MRPRTYGFALGFCMVGLLAGHSAAQPKPEFPLVALRSFASAAATAIYDAISTAEKPVWKSGGREPLNPLDDIARLLWRQYGEGVISEDDAEVLQSFINRRRPPTLALAAAQATPAGKPVAGPRTRRFTPRQRQRSPDRKASRDRRRTLGGSSALPDILRHHYTEGQRSVLCVIAGEIKRHGVCDLCIDKIAALAGVRRTTVQTTLHEARRLFHIIITERPRPGRKNLTNVVEIMSREWREWLKRAPSASRIGSNLLNLMSTTKITVNDAVDDAEIPAAPAIRSEAEKWVAEIARIAGHSLDRLPDSWRLKGVHAVSEWLQRLAKAGIEPKWLRNVAVYVMQRKPDKELPFSILYFEPEVARLIRTVERARGAPLPYERAVHHRRR